MRSMLVPSDKLCPEYTMFRRAFNRLVTRSMEEGTPELHGACRLADHFATLFYLVPVEAVDKWNTRRGLDYLRAMTGRMAFEKSLKLLEYEIKEDMYIRDISI